MRSEKDRQQVFQLSEQGYDRTAISRSTGIPRSTIRDWLNGPRSGSHRARTARWLNEPPGLVVSPSGYAYLLGIYLGDGHVVAVKKSFRLTISMDARYPGIVREAKHAISVLMPSPNVIVRKRPGNRCVDIVYSSPHLSRWFPQLGPGPKHTRSITLRGWQRSITGSNPGAFIRGLIHSDGSRYIAHQRTNGKTYAYARYSFSNRSEDILGLFTVHADQLGIRWNRASFKNVEIVRHDAVQVLDRYVGPKY